MFSYMHDSHTFQRIEYSASVKLNSTTPKATPAFLPREDGSVHVIVDEDAQDIEDEVLVPINHRA